MTIIFAELQKAIEAARPVVLCTVVNTSGAVPRHSGTRMLVYADSSTCGTIGGGLVEKNVVAQAEEVFHTRKSRLTSFELGLASGTSAGVCGGKMDVFIELVMPQDEIVIIGAGHVGRELAALSKWLNMRVAIYDNQLESFCNSTNKEENLSTAKLDLLHKAEQGRPNAYYVLTTDNHQIDIDVLPKLIKIKPTYIGVLGSKKRWKTTCTALLEQGVTPEELASIHSPAGIELEAETPREIALSILAEIFMVKNNASGHSMKIMNGLAHD